MVKIPLDKICVRVGVLCPSCEAKVASGRVQRWEIDVMKALLEAEEELGELGFEYVGAVKSRGTLYIITRGARSVPARLEEELAARLGVRRVRVVEEPRGPVDAIMKGLSPARVLGVDRYYSPDGSVYYVARVPREDRDLLPGRIDDARFLLERVQPNAGLEVRLVDASVPPRLEGVGVSLDREKIRSLLDRLGR